MAQDPIEVIRHGTDILMVFKGALDVGGARQSSERFVELIGADCVRLIIDIDAMTAYTREARQVWQRVVFPHRRQIVDLAFIGEAPPLVRMGASAVGLVLGVPMRFARRRDAA